MEDKLMTLKDYAAEKNISYEAVRKQVTRYKDELAGHITVQGRTQYLDEAAINFLNLRRAENPIVVFNKQRDDETDELRAKVKTLTQQLIEIQQKLLEIQDVRANLLEQSIQQQCLIEQNEKKAADYDRLYQVWQDESVKSVNIGLKLDEVSREKGQLEEKCAKLQEKYEEIADLNYENYEKVQMYENMSSKDFRKYKRQLRKKRD
jgi:predicted nuclease with TOPRIM domain